MKTIEINSKTDKKGYLKINYALNKSNKKVRVLIMVDESDDETWYDTVSQNPVFDFLKEEDEIYSLNDGKPFKN